MTVNPGAGRNPRPGNKLSEERKMTYEEMIVQAYSELMTALPQTIGEEGRALIADAFVLAREAHAGQTRQSGLPYILHPLAVARVVVREMRQKDAAIVAASLLHDVVEDTDYTIEDIQDRFGPDVAFLVGAVTKPDKAQVANFKHILGSVKGDVRVLILKLSDRLHNMRTLDSMKPEKQWKIASETRFFFAPLAGRLGLYKVKAELENLAFQFLNPQEYRRMEKMLAEDRERTGPATEAFMNGCRRAVAEKLDGVIWDIRYRQPYSVWREMQENNCDFDHVFKHYIRASFDSARMKPMDKEDVVMKIYSMLADRYREQTGTFVNYMAQPKANGYRSVHFRLLNPYGSIEEFHVASDDMREQSYFGCIVESKEQWLERFTKVLAELSEDPDSLMPGIRDSLFNEDIVVYTPKGKPVSLPKGATALDFAFEVHSDVGEHAKYAIINNRLSSVRTVLRRGDCVRIGTDPEVHPEADWMSSVMSYKAKKLIRGWIKRQPKPKYSLCPHCHPIPGGEIIGFRDAGGKVTVHTRSCPEAIRMASEQGHTIVTAADFVPEENTLYPVRIDIIGIDRYHLLRDIIDCIVEDHRLSLTGLTSRKEDNIARCSIDFKVHSIQELNDAVAGISAIDGVEEFQAVKIDA